MEDSHICMCIHVYIQSTIAFNRNFSLERCTVPLWNNEALAPDRFGSTCRLPEDLLSEALLQLRPFNDFSADREFQQAHAARHFSMVVEVWHDRHGSVWHVEFFCFFEPWTWQFHPPFHQVLESGLLESLQESGDGKLPRAWEFQWDFMGYDQMWRFFLGFDGIFMGFHMNSWDWREYHVVGLTGIYRVLMGFKGM